MTIKYLHIPCILFALTACVDQRADVIINYANQRANDEIYNSFTLKRISDLGTIQAGDSLLTLNVEYDLKREEFIREYHDLLATSMALRNTQEERKKVYSSMNMNQDTIVWTSELEQRAEKGNAAALVFKQRKLKELTAMEARIARYKSDPGVILATQARVTYTILNPLTFSTQEMQRTFVFSPDNRKVLMVYK